MTDTKQSGSKSTTRIGSLSLVLSGIALATTISPLTAGAAGTKPLPIERIGLDNARQLVVQFASEPGAFPSIPNVLDLPGPNHRVVVDFADTTIDRAKIPTVEEMTTAMGKVLPVINGIRYSILPNAAKPTARVVLELPEDLKVTPRVVKVEENSVTINLGDEVKNLVVPKKTTGRTTHESSARPATVPSPGGESVVSAVNAVSAPIPSGAVGAPVPRSTTTTTTAMTQLASTRIPLEDDAAPVMASTAAPVAVQAQAPVPVAYQPQAPAPVAQQAPLRTVTTTQYQAAPPVLAGQPVVNADGETVALKGEQKIDELSVPAGATKSSATASGWDWNSPVENELVSKAAATKSMSDGAAVSAPAVAQARPGDDPEEAFVKKIAAKEMGASTPVATLTDVAPLTSTTNLAGSREDAPAAAVSPVAQLRELDTATVTPVAQLRDVEAMPVATTPVTTPTAASAPIAAVPVAAAPQVETETAYVPSAATAASVESTAPDAVVSASPPVTKVAQASEPLRTEQIETQPLSLPEPAAKPAPAAAPRASAPVPADAVDESPASATSADGDASAAAPAAPQASGPALSLKLYNSAVRNHLSGKLMEAINDYKGALAANPSLAEAHSNLGLIYNQQHNYAGALGEFHKALAINPKDAITYNGIGAALRAEKDLPGAIKNWQTAVDLDPKLATAHYNLGTAFEIQKDYDRALEAYKDAITNDYRLGEAYYRMGLILQQKHQLDDAAAQYSQALKISSTAEYSADAKQRLAELKAQKK